MSAITEPPKEIALKKLDPQIPAFNADEKLDTRSAKLWMPKQVLITPAAMDEPYGQELHDRLGDMGLPVRVMPSNRITGIRQPDERKTYTTAKRTLAIVKAPPSAFKLQPIPPSADWQFHLAEGCPGHCQYCYLAGSLSGPPIIRVFANLPTILENTQHYQKDVVTSYEASCYTDPLSLEHLTGGLAKTIEYFGQRERAHLRWVTKYDHVEPLLGLQHNGHTRCRISLNAEQISRKLEGGTASVHARLQAMRQLALPQSQGGGNYPIGIVLAPIMQIPDWEQHYTRLLNRIEEVLDFNCDLTFELITHRFTPGSKDVLMQWYPHTPLEMDEAKREVKRNKFGGRKYVLPKDTMKSMKQFFYQQVEKRFPQAEILYWT